MASEVCPLLGLDDDRGAYLTYPSYENRCYAPETAESIPLNEQTFFCLGGIWSAVLAIRPDKRVSHRASLLPVVPLQPSQAIALLRIRSRRGILNL